MTHSTGQILTWQNGRFERAGTPHRIVAGAMHYFRVHPSLWRDRFERMVALGLNTIDTYVAWNVHQPRPGRASDFTGWNDLGAFIDLAGDLGLDVIVRPGPYICAEWENGGLPYWVTGDPEVRIRRTNPAFQAHVERWFDELLPHIVSRQASRGGPVVAVQIENEYGSYGDDPEYLEWNRRALADRGITELLFTADGGNDYFLDGGALPGVLATATLGSRGPEAMNTWARRRPGEPFLAVEFWNGWFDHWGEPHHVRDPQEAADAVAQVLDRGGSVCLYMAHGGTNFGLGAGSNHDGERVQPTVTSYDYDAPVAEDGRLTEKFHALRPHLHRAAGRELLPVPEHLRAPAPTLAPRTLELTPGTAAIDLARARLEREKRCATVPLNADPLTFDELDLPGGLVLYRGRVALTKPARLSLPGAADVAQVWLDGAYLGELSDGGVGLDLPACAEPAELEILLSAYGRINYGPRTGETKGLLGGVMIGQRFCFGWEHAALDLTAWGEPELDELSRASFDLDQLADAHLALPDSGRGFVWINDFLLGRFDQAGPQRTLYLPAGLMQLGRNEIRVLDLTGQGSRLELCAEPDLGPVSDKRVEASEVV